MCSVKLRRALGVAVLGAFSLAVSLSAVAAGCPNITAIGNFLPSTDGLSVTFGDDGSATGTDVYTFTSNNESPVAGVPGLIEYCVYPSQPPGNPGSASASASGANLAAWVTSFGAVQGYFSFKRPDGDPSNVPFDGSTVTMGTATWGVTCTNPLDPTTCTSNAPANQVILLHINDPDECIALYGGTSNTCFVYPGPAPQPEPNSCPGDTVACKSVVIDEAITTAPLTVPGNTLLHIHYTYIINNTNLSQNMLFNVPSNKTQDINAGGGKDYFGCEQTPDAAGSPSVWGIYPNYENTGFLLNFAAGTGGGCPQSRFFLTNSDPITTNPFILAPGQSITFTVDMVTRTNKGGNQEYTSCGRHLLNSGFTVKWFQNGADAACPNWVSPTSLCSFSTNVTPIYVNVVSGGNLVCQ